MSQTVKAKVIVSRTYVERIMFIGEPSAEKLAYVKKLGFKRSHGQWERYNSAQQEIEESALENTVKA